MNGRWKTRPGRRSRCPCPVRAQRAGGVGKRRRRPGPRRCTSASASACRTCRCWSTPPNGIAQQQATARRWPGRTTPIDDDLRARRAATYRLTSSAGHPHATRARPVGVLVHRSRTPATAIEPRRRKDEDSRSGPGRSSKRCATPASGSRSCSRSPTWRWCSYRLPDTGEIVPLLQIVPSKSDEERLLLVSPELASVLATDHRRLRGEQRRRRPAGSPLRRRTNASPARPLPHLFQRRRGWRRRVISTRTVQEPAQRHRGPRPGCTDAGRPAAALHAARLPQNVHHRSRHRRPTRPHRRQDPRPSQLTTTQAYLAVFQEELIRVLPGLPRHPPRRPPGCGIPRTHRRGMGRVPAALRAPQGRTRHCGRPYGTPCKHEHACIRCPMLRIDPTQRPTPGRDHPQPRRPHRGSPVNGWLGEVQGLQISLEAARAKLAVARPTRPEPQPHLRRPGHADYPRAEAMMAGQGVQSWRESLEPGTAWGWKWRSDGSRIRWACSQSARGKHGSAASRTATVNTVVLCGAAAGSPALCGPLPSRRNVRLLSRWAGRYSGRGMCRSGFPVAACRGRLGRRGRPDTRRSPPRVDAVVPNISRSRGRPMRR